mmetsp:Transcript_14036/g.18389  ORF Transcript_14036/g.18389 Transcript_14036/m.18389 type:complete len:108 (+) Transcript_14036:161-484(+)
MSAVLFGGKRIAFHHQVVVSSSFHPFERILVRTQSHVSQRMETVSGRRWMSDGDDRSTIENRDIAFKPAESGWGSGTKYASNYDNIFGKKPKSDDKVENSSEGSKDD